MLTECCARRIPLGDRDIAFSQRSIAQMQRLIPQMQRLLPLHERAPDKRNASEKFEQHRSPVPVLLDQLVTPSGVPPCRRLPR